MDPFALLMLGLVAALLLTLLALGRLCPEEDVQERVADDPRIVRGPCEGGA